MRPAAPPLYALPLLRSSIPRPAAGRRPPPAGRAAPAALPPPADRRRCLPVSPRRRSPLVELDASTASTSGRRPRRPRGAVTTSPTRRIHTAPDAQPPRTPQASMRAPAPRQGDHRRGAKGYRHPPAPVDFLPARARDSVRFLIGLRATGCSRTASVRLRRHRGRSENRRLYGALRRSADSGAAPGRAQFLRPKPGRAQSCARSSGRPRRRRVHIGVRAGRRGDQNRPFLGRQDGFVGVGARIWCAGVSIPGRQQVAARGPIRPESIRRPRAGGSSGSPLAGRYGRSERVPSGVREEKSIDRPIEHTESTYLEVRAAGASPPQHGPGGVAGPAASGPPRPGPAAADAGSASGAKWDPGGPPWSVVVPWPLPPRAGWSRWRRLVESMGAAAGGQFDIGERSATSLDRFSHVS